MSVSSMNVQLPEQPHPARGSFQLGLWALLAGCCCLCSCGSSKDVAVTGTVTFQKQPIANGRIYFTPDISKGNTAGGQGFAEIKDGKYDTRTKGARAVPPGKVLVRIEGYDGVAVDEETPRGKSLFYPHTIPDDLPAGSVLTKDYDVPASAKNPPKTKQPATVEP